MSRESDLVARIKKLEARENFLVRQVKELSRRAKPLLDLEKIIEILQAQEPPIEVIPIYGVVIGDIGGDEEGPASRSIIFGNGAPFARYVKCAGGKTVLRGKIIYKRDSYDGDEDEWDFATSKADDGLAFIEQPHIQAYFIPDYLETIKEEMGEDEEEDE